MVDKVNFKCCMERTDVNAGVFGDCLDWSFGDIAGWNEEELEDCWTAREIGSFFFKNKAVAGRDSVAEAIAVSGARDGARFETDSLEGCNGSPFSLIGEGLAATLTARTGAEDAGLVGDPTSGGGGLLMFFVGKGLVVAVVAATGAVETWLLVSLRDNVIVFVDGSNNMEEKRLVGGPTGEVWFLLLLVDDGRTPPIDAESYEVGLLPTTRRGALCAANPIRKSRCVFIPARQHARPY